MKEELTKAGIDFVAGQYGANTIAHHRPEITSFTIGIRADMDASILENNHDKPYRSAMRVMHACGHDAHATMPSVRLRRFTPSGQAYLPGEAAFPAEEGRPSGARTIMNMA